MKNIYLDWGVYKVRVSYDPEDINRFDVYYHLGSGNDASGYNPLDGKPYRRLTKPELKAAMEAIYAAEKIKITPVEDTKSMKTDSQEKLRQFRMSREDEYTRNMFARTALEVLLTKRPGADRKKLAIDSFEIADAMMEAKEKVHVEVCKNCHQEVKP